MRGSPILRSILLTLALLATAVGLQRVTSARSEIIVAAPPEKTASPSTAIPFHLTLSAPTSSVEISGKTLTPPLSGTLEIDPANPHVALVVRWKNPAAPGEHRFAKLTLDPPGQATITHVFDAAGDIDDLLELPFPAGK